MNFKSRAAIAVVLLGGAGATWWQRASTRSTAHLLERLPAQNALILFVDFGQLRQAGILQMLDGAKIGEDPEYQTFVRKTNFNYKQDLDRALVAFAPTGKFLLAEGRFDWKSLRAYAGEQGGGCYDDLCRMQGSVPERRISFFPLQSKLMALAVSPDESAAMRLNTRTPAPAATPPEAPVWLSIPVSALQSGSSLPDGTRMFARSLHQAESVTIALVPEGKRMAAKMTVLCRNQMDAADAALQLTRVTDVLRQMLEREHQKPNPADLSGVLSSGSFRPDGNRVYGYWPVEHAFLENMLAGSQ